MNKPDDTKPQKFKLTWWCKDCLLAIKITAVRTHVLNKHEVENVSYNPDYVSRRKKK